MSRLRTALTEHRRIRALLRQERAFDRVVATAPTLESAHELRALGAHR